MALEQDINQPLPASGRPATVEVEEAQLTIKRTFGHLFPEGTDNGHAGVLRRWLLSLDAATIRQMRLAARSREESRHCAELLALCQAVAEHLRPLLKKESPSAESPPPARTVPAAPPRRPADAPYRLPSYLNLNPLPCEGLYASLPGRVGTFAERDRWLLKAHEEYRRDYYAAMRERQRVLHPHLRGSAPSAEAQGKEIWPDPVIVDLDAFIEERRREDEERRSEGCPPPDARVGRRRGHFPPWMSVLSESLCTQLLGLLERGAREPELDAWLKSIDHPLAADDAQRLRVIRLLVQERPAIIAKLHDRLKELEWLPETPGVYVRSPNYLRMKEHDCLVPELRRIVERHFGAGSTPPQDRVLLDIGAWDGRLASRVARELCGTIVAVEPDPARFDALFARRSEHFRPIQGDIRDIVQGKDCLNERFRSDVTLLSHVLYFLHSEDDEAVLRWVQSQLLPGGIALTVLNDRTLTPGSRAHLRHAFRIRENAPPPDYYRGYLQRLGARVDLHHPTIEFQSRTAQGLVAIRDIIRYLLPGQARHNARAIDWYVDRHVRNAGREGQHRMRHELSVLVAHAGPLMTQG